MYYKLDRLGGSSEKSLELSLGWDKFYREGKNSQRVNSIVGK